MTATLSKPVVRIDRERWIADPRPDLASDHTLWSTLLGIAYDADGSDPHGTFGCLHALRCMGAGIEPDVRAGYRMRAGEMTEEEYGQVRGAWLKPRRRELIELMRRLQIAMPRYEEVTA